MNTCKDGARECDLTEKNRNNKQFEVTERTTVLARVLAAVFLSGYVTRQTEHAGKLKPFQQRGEMSGYVTRKTEHGGILKPPHRNKVLDPIR